ncbi:5993_t:CDS:2 [Cetraspora pellucida]|uniref:5993_t:CDS:1 n=1 Tax=Cetraspora pellucida TaxID=1433469 RepID=A0A9N9ESG0_9GLOM|nr:5993_t:CDS:2 [Cetraspora pellucida]
MAQQPELSRLSLPKNQAMIQNHRIQLERLVLEIYLWANAHTINAENQVADLQTPKLEKIERYNAKQLSEAYLHSNSDLVSTRKTHNVDTNKLVITKTEIEKLVRNTMASTQSAPSDKLKHPSFDTLECLNNTAGLSIIQTLIDTITKRVVNKFSSLLSKKSNKKELKNYEDDSDEDLADHMNKTEHTSHKCFRKKKNRSKKKDNVNKVTLDSGSDINNSSSSNFGSDSKIGSDAMNSSSESESDYSINIHVSKAKKTKPVLDIPKSEKEEIINNPMEIDFVQKKDPAMDMVTTNCKIKQLVILMATVDPGANFPIITKDIAKCLKLIIDTKEKHDLSEIATAPIEFIGIVYNAPVTFT